MSVIVVGHVVFFYHLDSPHILSVINPFKAGYDESKREAMLGTDWLAILAVADQTVVHGLVERNARPAFHGLVPFRHDEGRAALHASLLEQQRQGHAGPFATTSHPVRFLHI